MFAKQQLSALADRKRLLILEADLNRGLIKAYRVELKARLGWFNRIQDGLPMRVPWLAAGGAAAGLVAAWHWRKIARWIPAVLAGWRWVRRWRAAAVEQGERNNLASLSAARKRVQKTLSSEGLQDGRAAI